MFELMINETCVLDGIEYKRVSNDSHGHARVVVHFMTLPEELVEYPEGGQLLPWDKLTVWKSEALRVLGGKRYHGRDYGGGIAFQSFSVRATHDTITRRIAKRAEILGVEL